MIHKRGWLINRVVSAYFNHKVLFNFVEMPVDLLFQQVAILSAHLVIRSIQYYDVYGVLFV